jgi:phage terminase large subunit GpA-like protein
MISTMASTTERLPKHLGELVLDAADIFAPIERLTVSQAAEKYFVVHSPPAYIGPYKKSETPYMDEPMDMTMSRDYTGLVFVGPAQSGKSISLILAPMAYCAICNPMDIILYHMSQPAARDFSMRRIDRGHRHSPEWHARLMADRQSDNTYDKTYKSGMLLSISWPSINEMSSKPVPVVMFTDYDRMPEDVGGEGSPFSLGQKRTTTFRNLGMTIAESSPGHPVEEPKEGEDRQEKGAHEAPPCRGILSLYNQGTRCRWYWPCPECGEFFEANFSDLKWPTKDEDGKALSIPQMVKGTKLVCPHNDCRIAPENRDDMNAKGVWLAEGQTIDKYGVISGEGRYSKTASYWMKGPAARYTTWYELVEKFLNAERIYEQTGSEKELMVTVNTDQGEPYVPKSRTENRQAADLQARANKALPMRKVPKDVVALFALIDTQKYRWEVQIAGIRRGKPYDLVVVDRYKVSKSDRKDDEGSYKPVQPASYPEDWDLLIPDVIDKTYPLEDDSGHMEIAFTMCDSAGEKGRIHERKSEEVDNDMSVTSNAYNFYRRLRKQGKAERFLLLKGDSNPNAPRTHLEYPDSKRSDRHAGAAGEIPVLFLNVTSLKDSLNAMLDRTDAGGGMVDFPSWLPVWWFEELTAETRGRRNWTKLGSRRNEAWDLLVYALGLCVYRRVEKVDWLNPPGWLAPWDENVYVVRNVPEGGVVDKKVKPRHRFAELGAELA